MAEVRLSRGCAAASAASSTWRFSSRGLQGGDPCFQIGKAAREVIQVKMLRPRCRGRGRGPRRCILLFGVAGCSIAITLKAPLAACFAHLGGSGDRRRDGVPPNFQRLVRRGWTQRTASARASERRQGSERGDLREQQFCKVPVSSQGGHLIFPEIEVTPCPVVQICRFHHLETTIAPAMAGHQARVNLVP